MKRITTSLIIGLFSLTAMAQTPQPMPPLDVYGNLWVQDSVKAVNGVFVDSSGVWVPIGQPNGVLWSLNSNMLSPILANPYNVSIGLSGGSQYLIEEANMAIASQSEVLISVNNDEKTIYLTRESSGEVVYEYDVLPPTGPSVGDVLRISVEDDGLFMTEWQALPNHYATAAFGDSSLTFNLINGLPVWVTNSSQNLWSQDTIFNGFTYTTDFFTCEAPGTYLPSGMVTVTNNEINDLMFGVYLQVNGNQVGPAISRVWIANGATSSIPIPNYPAVLSQGDIVQVIIIPLNADADVTVSSGIITLNQIR